MKQVHIYITGDVQRVGYRFWTKRLARKLEITGWVKNLPDGRVEVLAQGIREKLITLIKKLSVGPFTSSVEKVEVVEEEIDEKFEGFEILR